ncbi:protein kinase [Gemmatimonadota bacterium]
MASDPKVVERLNTALADRYRIEREIGSGGMATVHLAEDLKHDRKVAVKVLKPELAAVMGTERFLAEIRTTANLSHPHILPLHDSGEADGFLYYVMPYVEGESLRQRLDRDSQLPVEEAVRIATRVADALDSAHRHGVIHRDLKPANILFQEGEPVVADFGIALAVSAAGEGRLTETGLSLGTPYYMSPEQAAGDQTPTPASDVYSLGCVLYEMLTGDPPHTGSSAQAILGKILLGEVTRPTKLRRTIPANVEGALLKALERLPADRFESVVQMGAALKDPSFRHGEGTGARSTGGLWNWLTLTLAVVAVLAMVVALTGWPRSGPEQLPPVERYQLVFQEGQEPLGFGSSAFGLSPDGSMLVYPGPGEEGGVQFWLRRWENLESVPIPGTSDASDPAISPDGSELLFRQGRAVKVAPLAGGPIRTLVPGGWWAEWGPDGHIYATVDSGTVRAPSVGGELEQVTRLQPGEQYHYISDFLPGGAVALVTVPLEDGDELRALDLATGEMKLLTRGSNGRYRPTGHLTFWTESDLMAAPFDPGTAEITGPEVPLLEDLRAASISETGKLVYSLGGATTAKYELVWVTRSGAVEPVDPGWTMQIGGYFAGWSLAPDESRLAVMELGEEGEDIWVKHLPDGPRMRLTFSEQVDRMPRWAPDGHTVTYVARRGDSWGIWTRNADGTGEPRLLHEHAGPGYLARGFWSPDGEWLVLRTSGGPDMVRDILALRPEEDSVPRPLLASPYEETGPALSPDGRWLAYTSDEQGMNQVFVRPFPAVESGKVQVSSSRGGIKPVWSRDGRELFFVDIDRRLMAARVEMDPTFRVTEVEELFTITDDFAAHEWTDFYDVTTDGQRFLMARRVQDAGESNPQGFILVNNFFTELEERVGR